MAFLIFIKGMAVGLAIAAPVGPVGLLCFHRGMTMGLLAGVSAGLGAALADAICGGIVIFGLAAIVEFDSLNPVYCQIIGGILLFLFGWKILLSRKKLGNAGHPLLDHLGALTTTFFLTITNPVTLIALAAIYSGMGLDRDADYPNGDITLVVGIFAGSVLWWVFLSSMAHLFKRRLSAESLIWVNRIGGILLIAFGIVCLGRGFNLSL
jgi:putative LysE/RhtB family amino acid efflux pump